MLVKVIYADDKFGMVHKGLIDPLLKTAKIKSFLRADGWVVPGRDPIRVQDTAYTAPDRRETFGNS